MFWKNSIDIYTDGSSKDGIGSWAFIIVKNAVAISEKSGRVPKANSNSMEFQAAIEALSTLTEKTKLTLYSDSRVLIDTMKSGKGPKAHQTQIDQLNMLNQKHQITWTWVKAHHGHHFNERCDSLCILARENKLSL